MIVSLYVPVLLILVAAETLFSHLSGMLFGVMTCLRCSTSFSFVNIKMKLIFSKLLYHFLLSASDLSSLQMIGRQLKL